MLDAQLLTLGVHTKSVEFSSTVYVFLSEGDLLTMPFSVSCHAALFSGQNTKFNWTSLNRNQLTSGTAGIPCRKEKNLMNELPKRRRNKPSAINVGAFHSAAARVAPADGK